MTPYSKVVIAKTVVIANKSRAKERQRNLERFWISVYIYWKLYSGKIDALKRKSTGQNIKKQMLHNENLLY